MEDLAKLFLLLLAGAFFVQLTRGTARQWLRAKFIGRA